MVLDEIGRTALSEESDPEKRRAAIILNALRDYNLTASSHESHLWKKHDLKARISEGAGSPITIRFEEAHRYFRKTVSAMTFMAK